MKCQVCQYDLPAGSTFCTNCGTPVPSNPYGSPASPSSPNQGAAPTILSSSTPPDPYGMPPANPYGAPPSNPYDAPPPASNPYNMPQSNPYGTPPSPTYDPNAGAFTSPPYGQPQFVPQQPKKKGPNGCVIAAVIVGVLLVLIIGGIVASVAYVGHQVTQGINGLNATATADIATANALSTSVAGVPTTTGTTGGVPTAGQLDPNAQANITGAQTANKVDAATAKPTHVTSIFSTSDTIYLTYTLAGNAGYVIEKTYDSTGTIVVESKTPHAIQNGDTDGYISFSNATADSYVSGLYWCQKSDCSDAALAQVLTFVVS